MPTWLPPDSPTQRGRIQQAFKALKQAMTSSPVLALPKFKKEFVVETDESGVGVGGMLIQANRLVAYFSQVLPMRSQVKSAYEGELMAIVMVVQNW